MNWVTEKQDIGVTISPLWLVILALAWACIEPLSSDLGKQLWIKTKCRFFPGEDDDDEGTERL